jgi:hypothetical protein
MCVGYDEKSRIKFSMKTNDSNIKNLDRDQSSYDPIIPPEIIRSPERRDRRHGDDRHHDRQYNCNRNNDRHRNSDNRYNENRDRDRDYSKDRDDRDSRKRFSDSKSTYKGSKGKSKKNIDFSVFDKKKTDKVKKKKRFFFF